MSRTAQDIWNRCAPVGKWYKPRSRNVRRKEGHNSRWPEPDKEKFALEPLENQETAWNEGEPICVAQLESKDQPIAPLSQKNLALMRLLNSWLSKEVQEDDVTWERLERVIDENRLSSRKFFT